MGNFNLNNFQQYILSELNTDKNVFLNIHAGMGITKIITEYLKQHQDKRIIVIVFSGVVIQNYDTIYDNHTITTLQFINDYNLDDVDEIIFDSIKLDLKNKTNNIKYIHINPSQSQKVEDDDLVLNFSTLEQVTNYKNKIRIKKLKNLKYGKKD